MDSKELTEILADFFTPIIENGIEKCFAKYNRKNTSDTDSHKQISLQEVAAILNRKPSTIYVWVSQNKIPFHKDAKYLFFYLDEIELWNRERIGLRNQKISLLNDIIERERRSNHETL